MAIVAGAGLLLSAGEPRRDVDEGSQAANVAGHVRFAFLPALVCVGWILLASQPGSGWQEGRIDSWSNSIGILGLVHSIGLWHGVLAFGFGLVLGLSFDGVPARGGRDRRDPTGPAARGPQRTSPSRPSAAGRPGAGRASPPALLPRRSRRRRVTDAGTR